MSAAPLLVVDSLELGYGQAASVVKDVSFELRAGDEAVILGANGAGKSTLLMALAGLLPVRNGQIRFHGEDITRTSAHERVRRGLVLALEGHRVVNELTVEDNLRLALYSVGRRSRRTTSERVEAALERFPAVSKYKARLAGTLSGGEQQMLVMARLFVTDASLMLIDEPSLGLSPLLIRRVYQMLEQAREDGKAVLVVEQSANDVLEDATTSYFLRAARLERLEDEMSHEDIARAYLG
jgi:branched-chain amino acid transport system ATP-binding protein